MLSLEKSVHDALCEWRVEEKTESAIKVSGVFLFSKMFSGFDGHFPNQPILPAIVQLAAVRHLAQKSLERNLVPVGCQRTKFRDIVGPQEELAVTIDLQKKRNNWQAKFSMQKGDELAAGGTLELRLVSEA